MGDTFNEEPHRVPISASQSPPSADRQGRYPDYPPFASYHFCGSELADYPFTWQAHIKVMLAQPHQVEPMLPAMTPSGPR